MLRSCGLVVGIRVSIGGVVGFRPYGDTNMNMVVVRALRPHEKKKLRRLKRQHCNAVNRLHARVVLLSRGGLGSRAIAERVDCSPQWVRILIHRFNADGIDGISWY